MTQKEMVEKMLKKQDELNIITNGANWKQMQIPWYRAIWTECAELLDYTPWKWWKHGELKLDDIKIETVDIWHFGMSNILELIENKEDFNQSVEIIIDGFNNLNFTATSIQEAIEFLAAKTLEKKLFNFPAFVRLCKTVNLSLEELYKTYIGKNILNEFRQDHGYKTGSYVKIWNGKEDNYYLIEILSRLNVDEIEEKLYKELESIYKNIG